MISCYESNPPTSWVLSCLVMSCLVFVCVVFVMYVLFCPFLPLSSCVVYRCVVRLKLFIVLFVLSCLVQCLNNADQTITLNKTRQYKKDDTKLRRSERMFSALVTALGCFTPSFAREFFTSVAPPHSLSATGHRRAN